MRIFNVLGSLYPSVLYSLDRTQFLKENIQIINKLEHKALYANF